MFRRSHWLLIAAVYAFLYLPLAVLCRLSFGTDEWTLHWYRQLLATPPLWQAFANSLRIAAGASILSALLGVALIYYVAQGGAALLPLFYGSLLLPETVLAVCLLNFFTTLGLPLGINTVIVSHAVLGVGVVAPLLYTRYLDIDPQLHTVSFDLGASPRQTFFKVTLPLLLPTLRLAMLLVFVLSFDDFVFSYFCAGSASQTLSLYIFSIIRSEMAPILNALAAVLIAFSVALGGLFYWLGGH